MSSHYYKYGILLQNNRYSDISSFNKLISDRRMINLYRWDPGFITRQPIGIVENKHVIQKEKKHISGRWLLLGRYFSLVGWQPAAPNPNKAVNWNKTLLPMHLLFKNINDLKEWMGSENYNKMVINLL